MNKYKYLIKKRINYQKRLKQAEKCQRSLLKQLAKSEIQKQEIIKELSKIELELQTK